MSSNKDDWLAFLHSTLFVPNLIIMFHEQRWSWYVYLDVEQYHSHSIYK